MTPVPRPTSLNTETERVSLPLRSGINVLPRPSTMSRGVVTFD